MQGPDGTIAERFVEVFGRPPQATARAPGRVNLIGEHTDYNQGFVLPAAIDRYITFAARRRPDRLLRAHALDLGESVEFSLDAVAGLREKLGLWSRYLAGVALLLEAGAERLPGVDLAFSGSVPRESGLSSSAALEMGAVALWHRLLGRRADPLAMARLGQRVENEFLGIPSGIMDQFISALGRRGQALLLDCRSLDYRYVPLPDGIDIVVANSGVKRALAKSEYGVRVQQCAAALAELRHSGVEAASLREVPLPEFLAAQARLGDLPRRRARHVITENQRVLDAVAALDAGHIERFGQLMNASHRSLRDDYQVSAPELDTLVEIAWKQPGVLGARMTGAGFGGCTVNLVRRESTPALVDALQAGFAPVFGRTPEVYVLATADGAFADSGAPGPL
ncbi:MAG TPA: galactokinase [Terriglobia bacterium]|nr:galactokinase [Terriglobia bacterium]